MAPANTAEADSSEAARNRLVREAYDWLYFVATEWSAPDAEDLVQEAITRTLGAWPRVAPLPPPQQRAFLKKVALRAFIDARRKTATAERHQLRASLHTAPDEATEPYEFVTDRRAHLNRAQLFNALTQDERVLLSVWAQQNSKDLSVEEAAKVMRMTPAEYGAAKKRLARTLQREAAAMQLDLSDLTGDPVPLVADAPHLNDKGSDDDDAY